MARIGDSWFFFRARLQVSYSTLPGSATRLRHSLYAELTCQYPRKNFAVSLVWYGFFRRFKLRAFRRHCVTLMDVGQRL